jgi:gliding motility-associated-like protein
MISKLFVSFFKIKSYSYVKYCQNAYFWRNPTFFMVIKFLYPRSKTFFYFFSLLLFFSCTINLSAQCAGGDGTLSDVCVITDPNSKVINLFSGLTGSPILGGVWKDIDKSGGLNKTTGILNAQLIKKSGTYRYSYTVTGVSGCTNNTAVVTITIGGYTGVPAPNASICSSDAAFNLFQAFDGNFLAPQTGGTWFDNDNSGGLNTKSGILNATVPVPDDTYSYTYSIDAIGSCPAPPAVTVYVSIYRSPNPGTPSNLQLCSDELATYTNLDLNTRLAVADPDGTWTDAGIGEITNDTDSTVDVQNIYNTRGEGTYRFTYTVISNNTVCIDQSSFVDITIEKQLDFTGATLVVNSDICENEIPTATYNAVLTQGTQAISDGTYEVTYTISGVALPIKTVQNFTGGVFSFPISSANFQQVKNYTIAITNIINVNSLGICTNIIGTIEDVLQLHPIPKINNATLTITPVCQNQEATVVFSGTSNLADGAYDILYNLSAPNLATAIPDILNVIGGISSFKIPTALIPISGNTTLTITKITNTATGCTNSSTLNKVFTVNPLPDVSSLAIAIKDVCQGQPATINLTGLGTLTDVSIDYTISGVNTVGSQIIALTAVGGVISFPIPATDIPNVGLTTFTITNVINVLTGCSIPTLIPKDFIVNSIPAIPVAADIQSFCTADNATVASLQPQGTQYQWFDTVTSTVPLIGTTPLISQDYFVKEVNALTGCESSLKTITVQINATPQINSATVTIAPICQGFNANVRFIAGTTNLTDGNYDIIYNLSGSNVATAVQDVLNVTGGVPVLTINSSLISKAGNTTIAITTITNALTRCSNTSTLTKDFVVNAVPDVSNMLVTVKDGCLGQDLNVALSGLGTLTNITLSYAVSGSNTIFSQTVSLAVSNGKTNFLIPASSLPVTGSNTLLITDLTNTANSCSAVFSPVSKDFAISAIPSNPIATGSQKFCETDLKTVASLTPNGNPYRWYDSVSSSTSLASDKLLVTGNYYVKELNATTGCESGPTTVSVVINTVLSPTLKPNGQEFCGIDKPTILNLSVNTNTNGNLTWYDAVSNGVLLANTELLTEGTTYYGFDLDTNTNCYSNPLAATVTLTDCTATPDNFLIPDGFSPNGDGVNETFQIVDIEFTYPNYTLEIFNRYGNVIFKGDINKPAWDGKNSNSGFINGDAPTGVYFYVIHYNKDNLAPAQGQLYLNR